MQGGRTIFPPKKTGEAIRLPFDFISALTGTETLSSPTVVATVWSGIDPTPSNIISGAASISGSIVSQLTVAGVAGCVYQLLCTVSTSLGQTLQMSAYLAILPTSVP